MSTEDSTGALGPLPEPVARVTGSLRLEWLVDHETAHKISGDKLITHAQARAYAAAEVARERARLLKEFNGEETN